MAVATDLLSLSRAKAELEIPAGETGHDTVLTTHITSAVDWIAVQTGFDYRAVDFDATTFPAGLVQAAALMVRQLYDGFPELRARSTISAMIRPYISYA